MKPRPPYLQTPDIVPGSIYLQIGLILGVFIGAVLGVLSTFAIVAFVIR